jgi:hypothetical protein
LPGLIAGTAQVIEVSLHDEIAAVLDTGAKPSSFTRSPKVTVLVPWLAPNPVPVIVMDVPTAAWPVERPLMARP